MAIVWEEPPDKNPGFRGGKWRAIAKELISHPGEWAVVHSGSPGVGGHVSKSLKPHGEFEVTQRKVDGIVKVFARAVVQ